MGPSLSKIIVGKYKGKKIQYCANAAKKENREVYFKVIEMFNKKISKVKIANTLGISRQTVYNILRRNQQ